MSVSEFTGFKTMTTIHNDDWDSLVNGHYKKKYYCFQQQDGCRERGMYAVGYNDCWAEETDSLYVPVIPLEEWINTPEDNEDNDTKWGRKFYPHVEEIAKDLYSKGLIPTTKFHINCSW